VNNSKPHVLILPEFLPFDKGWGGFTWNYINSIALFCDVTIFYSRLNSDVLGINEQNINTNIKLIQYFPYNTKPKGLKKIIAYLLWFSKCLKILKKCKKIDIIHAHGTILNGTLALKLSKLWKIPCVLTEHTGPFSSVVEGKIKYFWVKRIMEKVDVVLTVSNHLKNEILETNIHPKKIEVTYNPVNTELFRFKKNILFKNIVFAGRLDENKGGLRAIKAFNIFQKNYTDWTLTLCGDGREMQAIQQYISINKLENSVFIKGMLSEEKIALAFQQADIFISPTQFESFGMAIAEAMSCGLPIITTNKTAPKEYVTKVNGILLDVNDVEAMANALSEIANNLHQYNAENSRNQIVNQFSYNNFGKRIFSIYNTLIVIKNN
jgi:glycosyltransferase involved in cell wall biosynthesis